MNRLGNPPEDSAALASSLQEAFRSALRSFRHRKLFVIATILLLSLALAATNIMFTLVDAVLLRSLPFADPGRLAWLTSVRPDRDDAPFAMPDYRDLRDRNRTAQEIAAIGRWNTILSGSGPADRLQGVRVTSNLFHLLGQQASAGRLLVTADDDQPDSRVVVISHSLWQSHFGSDPQVVGRTVTLDNEAYSIVGVLPATFQLPVYPDAAIVAALAPEFHPWRAQRDSVNFLSLVARLRPSVTLQQAQSDMTAIARQLAQEFPDTNGRKLGVKLTPLQQRYTGNIKNSLLILLAAVVTMLAITWANLANLVMIQLASREGEFAIRMALGATQLNLVRQLSTENLIVALSSGLLAPVITRLAVPPLIRFLPIQVPRSAEISVAGHVFFFSLVLAVVSVLPLGVLPAFHWLKSGASVLSSTRGSSTRGSTTRIQDAITAGQIAAAVVLLISTALLVRSFQRLQNIDLGFDSSRVLTARISLPATGYKSTAEIVRFTDSFRANVAANAGVQSVGMISILPLSSLIARIHFSPGTYLPEQGQAPEAQFRVVTPDYFRAMGIQIEGRDFSDHDSKGSELVVIVNRELASRYWAQGSALGARLTSEDFGGPGKQTARIVGIVSNVKQFTLDEPTTMDIYIPLRQMNEPAVPWLAGTQFWVARTPLEPAALRDGLREALARTDTGAGASEVEGFDWYLRSALSIRMFNLALIAAFGLTSLLLAATGVYSVLSYSLALRRREIGTRLALGASPGQIIQMVLLQAARLGASGLVVGMMVALATTRLMRGMLFEIKAIDASAFSTASIVVFVTVLVSCVIPALRASRTDPLVILRQD